MEESVLHIQTHFQLMISLVIQGVKRVMMIGEKGIITTGVMVTIPVFTKRRARSNL